MNTMRQWCRFLTLINMILFLCSLRGIEGYPSCPTCENVINEFTKFQSNISTLLMNHYYHVTSHITETFSNITECEESPQCYNGTLFRNTNGFYECQCFEGWRGPNCGEDIDECNAKADPVCQNNGSCTNTNGSFSCDCKDGWDGPICIEDINECAENPCNDTSICINTYGSYICHCNVSICREPCEIDHSVQSYLDNVEYWNNPENQRRQLETLNETITEIKKNLTLDKTRLQSSINKRISADDPRLSAAVAGYIGALFISIVIGFFLMLDCIGLCLKSN